MTTPKGFFQEFDRVPFRSEGEDGLVELSPHFHGGGYVHWGAMGAHLSNLHEDSAVLDDALAAIKDAGFIWCEAGEHFVDKVDILGDGGDVCRDCWGETDPENIYGSASVRQSIEEDRK
jgi:hypothetical protein